MFNSITSTAAFIAIFISSRYLPSAMTSVVTIIMLSGGIIRQVSVRDAHLRLLLVI